MMRPQSRGRIVEGALRTVAVLSDMGSLQCVPCRLESTSVGAGGSIQSQAGRW